MIKLAVVEDEKEVCDSLQEYLMNTGMYSAIRTFLDAESFIQEIQKGYYPDVILQDIQLPGLSGIEVLPIYREKIPEAKILVNSILQNGETVFSAICAGALGYIEKGYSLQQIQDSILAVHRGGSAMSPAIARQVINFFNLVRKFKETLSPKESEIAQSILDGLSYKMIAEKHKVSIDTVRTHITRIYRKLEINSKGELINKYLRGVS